MQKDVVYIDTEDDITAIIGKVKASKNHIVALVPPKRIGAIQSAVNLKLVQRAAAQVDKRLVIITSNQALFALASSAHIPVAKNLQSKPELAEIPALEVDEDDDIIDGSETSKPNDLSDGSSSDDTDATPVATVGAAAIAVTAKEKLANAKRVGGATLAATAARGRTKIPNFDAFRKRLFLIIAGAIVLISFLVWAIFFAAQAKIVISAKTTVSALNSKVTIGSSQSTSLKDGTIKSVAKTSTKDVSIPFSATGQKDIGNKATGPVKFTNTSSSAVTIVAGTQLTSSSGLVFTVDSAVTVPAAQLSFSCPGFLCPSSANGSVTAAEPGDKYNAASGSLGGSPSGISATFTSPTSGGTSNVVPVVQQSDVDAVSGNVVQSADSDAAKKALKDQLGTDYVVIDETFKVDSSAVKPSPAVGTQATDSKGTLSGKITYSIVGVPKIELTKFLDAYYAQQIDGKANQKVYDNGVSSVNFSSVNAGDGDTWHVSMAANGKIGPNINESDLKNYAKGKKVGEIKTYVEAISGVDQADVSFSPFWVVSAPSDVNRIKVEFRLNG
jgi:hypothetical protein